MSHRQQLVRKLWNYRNIVPDVGSSCGGHLEQLTFLLFPEMSRRSGKAAAADAKSVWPVRAIVSQSIFSNPLN